MGVEWPKAGVPDHEHRWSEVFTWSDFLGPDNWTVLHTDYSWERYCIVCGRRERFGLTGWEPLPEFR